MNAHDPRLDPVAELKANVAVPFERAKAMPKSVYTTEEFLALEEKHVFAKDWICAGRAETLPNPGDYLTPVGEAMLAIVLADHYLRHRGQVG